MKTSIKKIIISICISLAASFFCTRAEGQVCAVKTNVLMWGGLTPNIGFEMVTGEHTSIDFSGFGHKNPYGLTSRVIALQPEFRYWFNGRPMIREYIGIAALFTTYDMMVRKNILDGDAVGLGVTGGYVFDLGKRFNLELTCSLGVVAFRQKHHYPENRNDYVADESVGPNSWGYKLIPIDLGVTFCYILK